MVSHQNLRVAFLNGTEVLVLHIHPMAHVSIGSSHRQPVQDVLHISIAAVCAIVDAEDMVVTLVLVRLVEDTQHHVQAIVDPAMQTGYLHNDAVVRQTVDEGIRKACRHHVAVVVERLVVHVEHRFLDVAHLVAQQVDGHHRQGVAILLHILGVRVVYAQVLTESECLRFEPCLLQLNQDQFLLSTIVEYRGTKVDTEYRQCIAIVVAILVWPYLHLHYLHLQQGRENGAGNTLILHQVLEHDIVNRVGNLHITRTLFCFRWQR